MQRKRKFGVLWLLQVLLCLLSLCAGQAYAQTFTTKQTLNFAAMANTSFGAAGNNTSVPGMKDVEGNQARIQNGLLDMANEEKPLIFEYPDDIHEGEQEIEYVVPATGSTGLREIVFRREVRGGTTYKLQVYVPLGANVAVYDTNSAGVLNSFATSPALGLNDAHSYRFRARVSGVGAASVFSIQIYDLTSASAHIFNAGSDTWSTTLVDTGTQTGDAGFLSRPGAISSAIYRSTGIPPALTVPVPEITARTVTGNTANVTFSLTNPVTGGTAPYGYQWEQVQDIYGLGAVNIAGATSNTVTRTGLTPDSLVFTRVKVTDAAGATVTSAVNGTVAPKLPYFEARNLRLMALGDSITAGGSPRPIETTATRLQQILGSPDPIPFAFFAQGGASGPNFINNVGGIWTSFKNAALAFEPSHVLMRIGVNDFASGYTAAQSAGFRLQIAQMIKAQIPSVKMVIMLHHTYTTEFMGGVQTPHPTRHVWSRQEQAIQKTFGNGTWLVIGPDSDYDGQIGRDDYAAVATADGLHKSQAGSNFLGESNAAFVAQVVIGSIQGNAKAVVSRPPTRGRN